MAPFVLPDDGFHHRAIAWEGIARMAQEAALSDGELVLINCAFALWSGRSEAFVGEAIHSPTIPHILQWLDSDGVARVLQAIGLKRSTVSST